MTFTEQWFSAPQAEHIANLAASVKSKGAIIEIGCWEGFSTYHIANAVYPDDVYCIDTWRGNEDESLVTGIEHVSVTAAKERNVYEIFCDNMHQLTKGNFIDIRMDWRIGLARLTLPVVAFLHIDASHDYASVYDCIESWYPFVVSGGIICGDDYKSAARDRTDLGGGVQGAVDDYFGNLAITVHSAYNAWWIHKP